MADPYGNVRVVVGVVVVADDCNIAHGMVISRRFEGGPRSLATPHAEKAVAGCSMMLQVSAIRWHVVGEIPVGTVIVVARSDRAVLHDFSVCIIMCMR